MDPDQLEIHVQLMRSAARKAYANRVPFTCVSSHLHRDILERAIRNVLSTELAMFTFAQIVDGLPTADVAWDRRYPGIFGDHIIDEVHEELCPGALEKARELHDGFDVSALMFDPKVLRTYQIAPPETKLFDTCLIELVAVALHQLGAMVYKLDLRLHQGDIESVEQWKMPNNGLPMLDLPPRPTLFNHPAYLDDDVYPEGLADVVGYWVEDRILGGIPLFDHKPNLESAEPPNVYFHSSRDRVTERVYQLRDEQQQQLIGFPRHKTQSPPPSPCPLPILGDKTNRVRVDAPAAMFVHHIYRDLWERKPITKEEARFLSKRPRGQLDYPEIGEAIVRINRQLGFELPQKRTRTPSSSDDQENSG